MDFPRSMDSLARAGAPPLRQKTRESAPGIRSSLHLKVVFVAPNMGMGWAHAYGSKWSKSKTWGPGAPQIVDDFSICLYVHVFPESVWAKGSSNSGGLLYIFICSHFHRIFSSSDFHIFTPSHLHIFSSSHLHIFTSLFHIFTSSHLLIFTSSHLLSLSLLLSPSSHLHTFSSSLSRLLSPSLFLSLSVSLSLSPSLSLALCHGLSLSFSFLSYKAAGSADEAPRSGHPFARNEVRVSKTEVKLRFWNFRGNLFARNEVRMSKIEVKCDFGTSARNEVRLSKTEIKFRFWNFRGNPFARNVKNWNKIAILDPWRQLFRTKWNSNFKNWSKIAILELPRDMKFECQNKNWSEIAILELPHEMRFECRSWKPAAGEWSGCSLQWMLWSGFKWMLWCSRM